MTKQVLEFKQFDAATAAATRTGWEVDTANGLAFGPEQERLFDWVDTHQDVVENDAVAFGIFDQKDSVALGVCEVTIQRKTARSKWVKMLRLHLKPSVDAKLQAGEADLAMNVFIESMRGSIGLQMTHSANTLKVFGRTNEQLNYLKALLQHLTPTLAGKPIKASIEGRFLSIVIT